MPSGFWDRIKGFFLSLAGKIKGFVPKTSGSLLFKKGEESLGKLRNLKLAVSASPLFLKIKAATGKVAAKIPDKKIRILIFAIAGAAVLMVIFAVLPAGSKKTAPAQEIVVKIPADEIFLPEEPDFIPKILLEREPRGSWDYDDAAVYWLNPLKGGEEQWRERLEALIDEFLESIP